MTRWSVRWLLLGVAAASLLLPLFTLVLLRLIDPYLVQQTERELRAEGALVAEAYRRLWAEAAGQNPGDPRPPERRRESFVALEPRLRDLNVLAPSVPEHPPARTRAGAVSLHGEVLSRELRSAQIFNLSGVRALDELGCAIASSRAQIDLCFSDLPEVQAALAGAYQTVLRERASDEPAPPFGSVRRRGDVRVFVGYPVFNDGRVIGAIWLSRTAESSLEFLFKQRRELFYGTFFLIGSVALVSLLFARLIVRPLRRMERATARVAQGGEPPVLARITAPREVHALALAFDALSARLRARADYVAEFAANVSHELKTPLTSIRGAIELLRDPDSSMAESQRQRFLANIDAATRRTERLVERLLLLARLENPVQVGSAAPGVDAEALSLDAWCAENGAHWGAAVTIHLAPEVTDLRLPALELDAVIKNLVDNALRARRTEPVTLRLTAATPRLHVSVEDDGPGVSPENQSRLFERFFTTERDRGGTGLGLAIVKAAALGRGGRVALHSSSRGTRAEVWL